MLFFKNNGGGSKTPKKIGKLNTQTYLDRFVWNDILREFRALPKERRDEILYTIYQKLLIANPGKLQESIRR